jgi:hypothetical protein
VQPLITLVVAVAELTLALELRVLAETAAVGMVVLRVQEQRHPELQTRAVVAVVLVLMAVQVELAVLALLLFVMRTLIQPQHLQQVRLLLQPLAVTVFINGLAPAQLHSNHGRLPLPLKCLWSLEPNGCTRCRHGE